MNCVLRGASALLITAPFLYAADQPASVSAQELLTQPEGDAILSTHMSGGIVIDGERYTFEFVGFEEVENDAGQSIPSLIGVFNDETNFVVLPVDLANETLKGTVILVLDETPLVDDGATIHEFDMDDDLKVGASGSVERPSGARLNYTLALAPGAGTSTFKIDGDTAYLNGDLGSWTYQQVRYLIDHHPALARIVFEQVPGSVNDEINVKTGRLIRDAGFRTELMPDSVISSGGVDLFLAGQTRIIADGAKIGVHSWGDPTGDLHPASLPRDHPAHSHQIDYFSAIMQNGVEFYFYTLNAAEFDDIHWMTPEEIDHWQLATE